MQEVGTGKTCDCIPFSKRDVPGTAEATTRDSKEASLVRQPGIFLLVSIENLSFLFLFFIMEVFN